MSALGLGFYPMQKGGDKVNEEDEYQEGGVGMVLPAHVLTSLLSLSPVFPPRTLAATCSPLEIRFLLCFLYCVIPASQP